jgi:hypothetical protein
MGKYSQKHTSHKCTRAYIWETRCSQDQHVLTHIKSYDVPHGWPKALVVAGGALHTHDTECMI